MFFIGESALTSEINGSNDANEVSNSVKQPHDGAHPEEFFGSAYAPHAPAMLSWEILYWLLCYPFTRSDDLAVLCCISRSTVVRELRRLEDDQLIEWVTPSSLTEHSATRRLYHLADAGFHALARALMAPNAFGEHQKWEKSQENPDAPQEAETTAIRKTAYVQNQDEGDAERRRRVERVHEQRLAWKWRTGERQLVRLLPQLHRIVRIEEFVRGIAIHAHRYLGERGYQAHGEWTWSRFYRIDAAPPSTGSSGRARVIRHTQVDGVFAFHVDGIGGSADTPLRRADRWHTALVIADSWVQDWRSASQALETIIRSRLNEEYWSQHPSSPLAFPPLLLLASSERHCERWLHLAVSLTTRRRESRDPLWGAVAVIPGPGPQGSQRLLSGHKWQDIGGNDPRDPGGMANPWSAAWCSLEDGQSIHLSKLLGKRFPREALLPGIEFPIRRVTSDV